MFENIFEWVSYTILLLPNRYELKYNAFISYFLSDPIFFLLNGSIDVPKLAFPQY